MPKGKKERDNIPTSTRSIAFKARNGDSRSVIKDERKKNHEIAALQRLFAILLGFCDEERAEKESQWLQTHAPLYFETLKSVQNLLTENVKLRGALLLIVLLGARGKDAFYALALLGKKDDSLRGVITGLINKITGCDVIDKKTGEVRPKEGELEKLYKGRDSLIKTAEENKWNTPPHNGEIEFLEKELEALKNALEYLDSPLENPPLKAIKDHLLATYKSGTSKLLIEAACQVLLGYYMNTRNDLKKQHALRVQEWQLKNGDEEYREFLDLVRQHPEVLKRISQVEKKYLAWREYLQEEIFRFKGDATRIQDLSELTKEELLKNRTMAWFDKNYKLFTKFGKGIGDPTGLTFTDFDEHPFDSVLSGERTAKGAYKIICMPQNGTPGIIQIKLLDGSYATFDIGGRGDQEGLQEKRPEDLLENSKFPYLYQLSYGGGENGDQPIYADAALGGLRIRCRGGELYLDLVVNLIAPKKRLYEWDKDKKQFCYPVGTVFGGLVFEVDGSMLVRKMISTEDGLKHLKSIPVEITSHQYQNLEPLMVHFSDGSHRKANKKEFNRALDALMRLSKAKLREEDLLRKVNASLNGAITIDQEGLRILKAHLKKRNDRSSKKEERITQKISGSLGRLFEVNQGISRMIREVYRARDEIKRLQSLSVPPEQEIRNLTKVKSTRIKTLKRMRRKQLKMRDNRVRVFSHEIARILLGSSKELGGHMVDVLILPEIKDKDPVRKASRFKRSQMENTLLLAGRSAEICERVEELLSLFQITVFRASTYKAGLICPKCGCQGVLFFRENGKIVFTQNSSRRKGEQTPMPRVPSFGCPNDGCPKEMNSLHLAAGNLISRMCGCLGSGKANLVLLQPQGLKSP